MDTNQKLGLKVFYYYLSKNIAIGLVLLAISFIVSSLKAVIVSKLIFVFSLSTCLIIVNYLVNGLFVASFVLIIWGLFISYIRYINCDFTLGENAFSIRRGIFNKKEVFIPYRQIENINIEQSFNFKMMGVSKLTVETASNSNGSNGDRAEGVFDVIDSKLAIEIRDFILQKTNIQTVR